VRTNAGAQPQQPIKSIIPRLRRWSNWTTIRSQGLGTAYFWETVQTEKRSIRLAANGHTYATIADLVGTTEGTIRNRRHWVRYLTHADNSQLR
jgi:DNA-binding NarL/FixJ family response regulator